MAAQFRDAPSIDPLALPGGTSGRFVLLFVFVVLAAWHLGTYSLRLLGITQWQGGPTIAAGFSGVAAVLVIAAVIYLSHPLRVARRARLMALDPARDAVFARGVQELAGRSGVAGVQFRISPDLRSQDAQAYGLPWRPQVRLDGGLRVLFRKRVDLFEAVALHELAHIRNGDLPYAYIGRGLLVAYLVISSAFIAKWLLDLAVNFYGIWVPWLAAGNDVSGALDTHLPLLITYLFYFPLIWLILWLAYARLLRVREHYADWLAMKLGADHALTGLLTSRRHRGGRLARLFGYHPASALRAEALSDAAAALRLTAIDGLLLGALYLAFGNALVNLSHMLGSSSDSGVLLGALLVLPLSIGIAASSTSLILRDLLAGIVSRRGLFEQGKSLLRFVGGMWCGVIIGGLAWPTSALFWVQMMLVAGDIDAADVHDILLIAVILSGGFGVAAIVTWLPASVLIRRWRKAARPRWLLLLLGLLTADTALQTTGALGLLVFPFAELAEVPYSSIVMPASVEEIPAALVAIGTHILAALLLTSIIVLFATRARLSADSTRWPLLAVAPA